MIVGEDSHTVVVDGVDICRAYGLVMLDTSSFEPPEPKTYTVDIPGGNGVIDLTEAMTGDVAFERREQEMEFACEDKGDWMSTLRRVQNFLHGRAFDYQLSFDPDYTYHGRFQVTSTTHVGKWGESTGHIVLKVSADPYKSKGTKTYSLNASGGRSFTFWSGRRPVHPTIECESACRVEWGGESINVPAGTYILRSVVFREGANDLYVESGSITSATWESLGEGGENQRTWGDLATFRWCDLQRIAVEEQANTYQWSQLNRHTWADLGTKKWSELNYTKELTGQTGTVDDSPVYLSYEWEDL